MPELLSTEKIPPPRYCSSSASYWSPEIPPVMPAVVCTLAASPSTEETTDGQLPAEARVGQKEPACTARLFARIDCPAFCTIFQPPVPPPETRTTSPMAAESGRA